MLKPDHLNTLNSFNNLGLILENLGKYEEAEAMHRQALKGYEKALGPEHLNTINSLNNIGWVLKNLGMFEEAEAMHRRALERNEKC